MKFIFHEVFIAVVSLSNPVNNIVLGAHPLLCSGLNMFKWIKGELQQYCFALQYRANFKTQEPTFPIMHLLLDPHCLLTLNSKQLFVSLFV